MRELRVIGGLAVLVVLVGCSYLPWNQGGIQKHSGFLNNGKKIIIMTCYVDEEVSFEGMEEFARKIEYRERGNTLVLFFDSKENTPEVGAVAFDWSYQKYGSHLVAAFYKRRDKQEAFLEAPIKKDALPYDEYATGGH